MRAATLPWAPPYRHCDAATATGGKSGAWSEGYMFDPGGANGTCGLIPGSRDLDSDAAGYVAFEIDPRGRFAVSGTPVTEPPRAEVDPDGIAGFRIDSGTNAHVAPSDVAIGGETRSWAPKRPEG